MYFTLATQPYNDVNDVDERMILSNMTENIITFFEQTMLRDHIQKTWWYNDNCFVIDFRYKGVRFALDFTASRGRGFCSSYGMFIF